jgi:hypothetical protein
MPAITIQQAYSIALQAYIDTTDATKVGRLTCSTGLTSTSENRLKQLLSATAKDLGNVVVTSRNEVATTLIANANTPNEVYTLVTSTTNANNNAVLDYLEGGHVDNTTGTLSVEETKIHTTGRAIFNKIKK